MTVERGVRLLAGSFVLIGLALGWLVHPGFLALPAFVGLNLVQSAFTGIYPAARIFRAIGLHD